MIDADRGNVVIVIDADRGAVVIDADRGAVVIVIDDRCRLWQCRNRIDADPPRRRRRAVAMS